MRAVLLAAGRGKRLGSSSPKVLVEIAGKTLLERHLHNMFRAGVTALTVVVGFEQHQIREALSKLNAPFPIALVENPDFLRGSILSLLTAVRVGHLDGGGIWMDADVLYPAELLRRLVASKHENCLLIDPTSEESGEEMMVGFFRGRANKIARRVGPNWEVAGETVGFAKAGASAMRVLRRILEEEAAAGRVDQEYEAAMDKAFAETSFGFEAVDDLAWTEIDFPSDIEKAIGLLPRVEAAP
ncbi:MAG: phosphocholine cytidylyltransferase family protein [Polyangiaceae bacterium]|nr:phosphocholine cytidylyltransferase family protein [Polyangiaceae bacterium]